MPAASACTCRRSLKHTPWSITHARSFLVWQARLSHQQAQLERGDRRLSEASRKAELSEAEAQQLALRMGLFQRMVTADAGVQYLAGARGRRDPKLDRHLRHEAAARAAAWGRIHELDGAATGA